MKSPHGLVATALLAATGRELKASTPDEFVKADWAKWGVAI
jgi:hypothetical protein